MEYSVIRTDRRSLAIQVDRQGAVVVRAPRFIPAAVIRRFVESRAGWIGRQQAAAAARAAAHPEPTEAEQAAYIARAKALLPARVAYFAGRMGVCPAGVKITGARTRFGSCSGKNRLCFSWRLLGYPPEAVDYVVVHELAHIRHKNHGPDFYAAVAEILPDYKARQRLLKE